MNHAHNMTEWTQLVILRDDFTCQYPGCGQNHNLDAAHIVSRRANGTLALFVPNGVTLCRVHHDYLHRHPQEWRAFVAWLLEQRCRGYVTVAYA
jgi:hypothetical protein